MPSPCLGPPPARTLATRRHPRSGRGEAEAGAGGALTWSEGGETRTGPATSTGGNGVERGGGERELGKPNRKSLLYTKVFEMSFREVWVAVFYEAGLIGSPPPKIDLRR